MHARLISGAPALNMRKQRIERILPGEIESSSSTIQLRRGILLCISPSYSKREISRSVKTI